MKRFSILMVLVAFGACGGGEPADTGAEGASAGAAAPAAAPAGPTLPGGEMTQPEWFMIDEAARTAHLTITAGATDALNHWNFNGATKGSMVITVPEGFEITIDLVNNDPVMAHSLGISAETRSFGAMMDTNPVFAGAVTENPTSMVDGTMPGETDTITFTAATAGTYSMVCFIPGHATTGMWIYFVVSSDGSAGVQGGAAM